MRGTPDTRLLGCDTYPPPNQQRGVVPRASEDLDPRKLDGHATFTMGIYGPPKLTDGMDPYGITKTYEEMTPEERKLYKRAIG